jgi:GrpB-like predicted nucleotidyltransferase (UPF0157 family)
VKSPTNFTEEYFLKYRETPVKLKPYSSKQEKIAKIYLKRIGDLLNNFDIKLMTRGSTAFKILGKGEVEVGVYPKDSDWLEVVKVLSKEFGEPETVEENYIRFNEIYKESEKEVEIILLKGREAEVDIKLHKYLIENPNLLEEYEEVKKKYCFSKREYQRQKNIFLNKVIGEIPDY